MGPAGRELSIAGEGPLLRGESAGEGPIVVCAHGLTATRRYVLHGSRALERKGYAVVSYDARGHGESDPAPDGSGYTYVELAGDLERVVREVGEGQPVILAGHSMGTHTIAALALEHPELAAGLVLAGPVHSGAVPSDGSLAQWDELADGLERAGVDGFMAAYEKRDFDPDWRETILRITRERLELHRHPQAVARALREVPRSSPFDDLSELEGLRVPALVVASHDEADPAHPYAVSEEWAQRLPEGSLVSEEEGASPLAWQGGKLAREIAAFAASEPVHARL